MFFCSLAITKIQLFIEKLLFLPYYFGVGNFSKVCSNHDWTESYGADPSGRGNAILTITEAGIYDVTFTFNSVTKEVSATAVRTDTDGISQIAGDVKAKSVVFNLQGHRVSTPKQGVYIINGKKVVVK